MTVHVPGASVIVRKPRWKQLLPEIPATRLACITSGSFRPKLGFGILFLLLIGCIVLVLVPLFVTPTLSPFLASGVSSKRQKQATAMDFNKEAVEAVADANANFGNALLKILAKPDDNLIMSSYSVSSVLNMILHGAEGNTASQLKKGLSIKDFDVVKNGFKDALTLLKTNENFTLNAANRIYHSTDSVLGQSYIQSTKEYFLAEPVAMDFGKSEESRVAINEWVEEQTNNKIQELIAKGSITGLTKLVLVNAIYFKGDWDVKFNKNKTKKRDFHVSKEKTVQADMMYINEEFGMLRVKELKGAIALDMPYKGKRLSMIFLLPDETHSSLEDLEDAMSKVENLNGILKFGKKVKCEVSLPKFKLESQLDLNEPLQELGMTDMFNEGKADFSGMTGGTNKGLYVSQVVQKAFVEVNEEGAEAAAATAGIMMMRAMPLNPQFTCDRPFMFLIRDNLTGMIPFSGHVRDPTK